LGWGAAAADDLLPPPSGPENPRVTPVLKDGLYTQAWFQLSSLDFRIVRLDLGSREVTDFDGRHLTETALAERWGVIFTPTIVFLKDDLAGLEDNGSCAGGD
jgi:hypothetical protein